MANATDGTQLNPFGVAGGDVISTEDMPVGAARLSPNTPLTDYKLPRSKIALGTYDQDSGDVTEQNPMPVKMMYERGLLEYQYLQQADSERYALQTRSRERVGTIFMDRGRR